MEISKSYMCNDSCHMWVAEWHGRIVGMVGLIADEKQKPGVAEVQRMTVSSSFRKIWPKVLGLTKFFCQITFWVL